MKMKYAWSCGAAVVVATLLFLATRSPDSTLSEVPRSEDAEVSIAGESESRPSAATLEGAALVSAHPTVVPANGYIGSESCKECHTEHHQSWHTSYHRTMTQLVGPDTAPEAIIDQTVEVEGQVYRFRRRDDDFLVELEDPLVNGARRERKLVMMTGSHHMHVFWYESGIEKTPAQLPILYLIDEARWIPRRSAFLRPPTMEKTHELGRWNQTCCKCHSTNPRQHPDPIRRTWDTQVADFGISCEACHGPGERHVQIHESKVAALEDDDPAGAKLVDHIVNPVDLPSREQSDLCGQCHGIVRLDYDIVDEEKYFKDGPTFRPGDRLDEAHFHQIVRGSKEHWHTETFQLFAKNPMRLHGHFWPDGEVRVSGRDYNGMIESPCYKKGELACISCHTLHQQDVSLQQEWKDDQLKPQMRGDAACLQCHPKYEELGTAHTHHPFNSTGSRCMNCHMPHTVYGILKTIRSHTISSPSVATSIETGRPNACNLCHLDHTLEQTSDHLAKWYGHKKPDLTKDEKETAASLLHFLSGDAASRVLQVNAFQWQPAREVSGTDWLRPYLLVGMDDSYEAIRLISERGYKTLPGAAKLDYDFLSTPEKRQRLLGGEYQKIREAAALKPNPALLIDENGQIDQARFEALINDRNHRPVYLQE